MIENREVVSEIIFKQSFSTTERYFSLMDVPGVIDLRRIYVRKDPKDKPAAFHENANPPFTPTLSQMMAIQDLSEKGILKGRMVVVCQPGEVIAMPDWSLDGSEQPPPSILGELNRKAQVRREKRQEAKKRQLRAAAHPYVQRVDRGFKRMYSELSVPTEARPRRASVHRCDGCWHCRQLDDSVESARYHEKFLQARPDAVKLISCPRARNSIYMFVATKLTRLYGEAERSLKNNSDRFDLYRAYDKAMDTDRGCMRLWESYLGGMFNSKNLGAKARGGVRCELRSPRWRFLQQWFCSVARNHGAQT